MKLSEAACGDVVQNVSNTRFYRFERPEEDRIRIRPLELFPNGLLIEKPVDTIVEGDLEVRIVASWHDDLFVVVEPGWSKQRRYYEREQADLGIKIASLLEQAEIIDPKQRGSHANKIRSVRMRLDTLRRGLEKRLLPLELLPQTVEPPSLPDFNPHDVVQLPSGMAARFVNFVHTDHGPLAMVSNATGAFTLLADMLKPIDNRWLSTV